MKKGTENFKLDRMKLVKDVAIGSYVTANKRLLAVTVTANKRLLAVTVTANKGLLAVTITANKRLLAVT